MDALHVVIKLLEKASVLVAVVLVLVLIKPARVWLRETGREASVRRRLFLAVLLGAVAVWGVFLGMDVGGQRFNVRMLGIIVAGFLGGRKVGTFVGALAGIVYAYTAGPTAVYAFLASVLVGGLSGWWSRRFGTRVASVALGATLIQLGYHALIGSAMLLFHGEVAAQEASNLGLHLAKIAANVVGVTVFMGLLNLVGELERLRLDAVESQAEVRSARLEALQYQVRPHFLFNLLNTLAYLIRTDPTKARELTLNLSDFLRYTLADERQETTLRDELTQIERYIELERARFGDELEFKIDAAEDVDTASVLVPPLILQPLVENAIRHGARKGKVQVDVEIRLEDAHVHIEVLDDGPGPPDKRQKREDPPRRAGVGLENVRERLIRFYGDDVQLTLSTRPEGRGACAAFAIPYSGKLKF